MKKTPVFNFVVEIVPMPPSALKAAAEIVEEVNKVARTMAIEQANKESCRSTIRRR